jgi:hypothetical protein
MSNNGFSSVDYAILSESLLPSVKYFKTNDFTYLSDHVQIELYLKCSITGVIWYFEPHGKLNPGSIYIHDILNPLIEN